MQLRSAERRRQHLRIALTGPPGSGKTFTALRIAHGLGGRIGVIDTENGSAELYAAADNPDGGRFAFDVIDLAQEPGKFSVDNYVKALRLMAQAGVQVVVVDSGSHAWAGPGGVLELVDNVASRSRSANKFTAWAEGTPKHNEFLQALLSYPGHLLLTLRSKMEFVQEKDSNGKTTIRKVGLAPVQRDGIEYEFSVVGDIDCDTHRMHVTKSRCSALADRSFDRPGADVAQVLLDWLAGAIEPEPTPQPQAEQPRGPTEELRGWNPKQQRTFYGGLSRLHDDDEPALDYKTQLAPWCERPEAGDPARPSQMTERRRAALMVMLSSRSKRDEIRAWAAQLQQMVPDPAEHPDPGGNGDDPMEDQFAAIHDGAA